ncbi:MAG: ParB/RepB/Spo0J family partition protein [Candidatus Fermentibacteraceae bacterium]|nr:ParB/RepB/Spo0J family partition protein [Candidatus Fermentibacteraceae bacterium]
MTTRKRKALGRGLEEIFPGIDDESYIADSREVDINLIDPNPFQPRKEWRSEDIASLAASIRAQGIIQPLILRKEGKRFQLIAGERRLRAAKEAGLKKVPVIIREADSEQMLALALVENIQRQDLGPMEKAEAFKRLSSEFSLTQEDMGNRVGMSRSSVANFLRLLDLPDSVQKMLREGQLQMGHGKALLGLDDTSAIQRAAVVAFKKNMSVRQLEEKIRLLVAGTKRKSAAITRGISPEEKELVETLQRLLKTRVRIRGKGKKGRIEISYHSLDELERILAIIRSGAKSSV